MASKPKPKEFSKEDLTCVICLDRLKEPTLLPCLHTYCKACLEGLLRKSTNRRITCPQCRLNHPLPTGAGGFPADRVLENALDLYTFKEAQAKHTALPCSMCTEDDPSVAHCSTCGKFLCDFCAKAHRRQVNFRDHKVVTLNQLSADVVKSLERPRYCSHHPEETLKLYCNTCQALICRDCSIVDHQHHTFSFAKDARSKVQLQLEQTIKRVAKKQQEFEAHLAFIKEAEKTRDAYSLTLSQQVNQAFDSFIRSLESLRQQLLGEETVVKASDMKQIWAQKQSIEMTLANIASGLRYAERLRGCPSDVDMLAMSSKAREQLVSLQKAQWNPKSDLTCSPLLLFSSKGQEYVKSVATLKARSPDVFTISIQPYSPMQSTTVPYSPIQSTIGEKVRFLVEVRAIEKPDIILLMVPSISIKAVRSHSGSSFGASVTAARTQQSAGPFGQRSHSGLSFGGSFLPASMQQPLIASPFVVSSHSGLSIGGLVTAAPMQQSAGLFGQAAVSSHSGLSLGASVPATPMQQPAIASPFVVRSHSGSSFGASVTAAPMQQLGGLFGQRSHSGSSFGASVTAAPIQQPGGLFGQRSHSGSSFGASVTAAPMQSFPGYEVMWSHSAGGSSGGSQQTYGHSVNYTIKHKRGGFWLVEFMPLHAGQFTVSAGISGSGMGAEDRYGVTVTGTFSIGGRVQRGPDWTLGNTDGGIGNKGTVIEEQEYTANYRSGEGYYAESKLGRQLYTYVRWDNGNYGQYSCNQVGPYQLELVPDEEK